MKKYLLYADIAWGIFIRLVKGYVWNKHTVIKKKTHTEITYTRKDGIMKKLYVPSGRKITMNRHCYKHYLLSSDGAKSIIDVSDDYPILVSAKDLGGIAIEVQDLHGKIVHTYSSTEVPKNLIKKVHNH